MFFVSLWCFSLGSLLGISDETFVEHAGSWTVDYQCIIWKFMDSTVQFQKELRRMSYSYSEGSLRWSKCAVHAVHILRLYHVYVFFYTEFSYNFCILITCFCMPAYFRYMFYAVFTFIVLHHYLYYFYHHFWQNIFLYCTLNFSKNVFSCPILIFGEFRILWILVRESASLPLWKLKMSDTCFTSSGMWPGLTHLGIPILDFEWSFIFRWHRKPEGINI